MWLTAGMSPSWPTALTLLRHCVCPKVERSVSTVSAYPGVRKAMVAQQRRIAGGGRVVMVGRDIGTAVLPDAELKIYLDASLAERTPPAL